jgi:hypothetical protein
MSPARSGESATGELRAIAFSALALYIGLSPFFVQVAGLDLPFIRPWIMFKEVGVGVLKGEFEFSSKDGAATKLTPLEILGLERYPVEAQTYRFKHLVFTDAGLKEFAADFCRLHEENYADLSFRGRVGAGASWRPIAASDLCTQGGR